jgi:hypothetical protein
MAEDPLKSFKLQVAFFNKVPYIKFEPVDPLFPTDNNGFEELTNNANAVSYILNRLGIDEATELHTTSTDTIINNLTDKLAENEAALAASQESDRVKYEALEASALAIKTAELEAALEAALADKEAALADKAAAALANTNALATKTAELEAALEAALADKAAALADKAAAALANTNALATKTAELATKEAALVAAQEAERANAAELEAAKQEIITLNSKVDDITIVHNKLVQKINEESKNLHGGFTKNRRTKRNIKSHSRNHKSK